MQDRVPGSNAANLIKLSITVQSPSQSIHKYSARSYIRLMITLHDISLQRGTKLLFEHVMLAIFAKQKINVDETFGGKINANRRRNVF